MKSRSLILFAAVILISGIGGYTIYQGSGSLNANAAPMENAQNKPMAKRIGIREAANRLEGFTLLSDNPALPGIEIFDEQGNTLTFERFKGKVVLFNLWATWCPPCIREMPDLNALQAQYKDQDFIVVPVASGRQGKEEPAEFLRKRNFDELTTYYDPYSHFLSTFNLETLPSTFVIDRDGNMRGGVIGILDWNSDEAKALVSAFLDEQKS